MRYLIMLGGLIFTLDHPFLVAFAAAIYTLNLYLTQEEKEMLKDYASKGSIWLTNLNKISREKGLSMKKGREVTSDVMSTLFEAIPAKDLDTFFSSDINKDKLNKFIVNQLQEEEEGSLNWDNNFTLSKNDFLGEDETALIKYLVPNFNWKQLYSQKEHRKLFKKMKAHFRNNDGSIRDTLGNSAILNLEAWVFANIAGTSIPSNYGQDLEIIGYLMNKGYTNV